MDIDYASNSKQAMAEVYRRCGKMSEYVIRVKETIIAEYSIDAASPEEAAALAQDVANISDREELECISREVEEITAVENWEQDQAS